MCWELGSGIGHMANLKPIAEELVRRGHTVSVALRDLARARVVFGDLNINYWQAPLKLSTGPDKVAAPFAYVHLLQNVGCGDFEELITLTSAWRAIYAAAEPDVVLFDYSPTAMVAARGCGFRRAILGSGFFCPPAGPTLPIVRPDLPVDMDQLRQHEADVLIQVNRVLDSWSGPRLDHLSDLFGDVDETFLLTFAELDHFGPRKDVRYWGVPPFDGGDPFTWPNASGSRIFAYLKPSRGLPGLLQLLATWQFPTVVYADGIEPRLMQQHASHSLHFSSRPLDMRQVAAECDLAIINANHATLAMLLRAGKPAFLMPPFIEQYLLARQVCQQAYCEFSSPHDAKSIESELRKMLSSTRYSDAATRFAAKYAGYDGSRAVAELASRIEELFLAPPIQR
jgi:hypothetical protein